jgi:hypothetical protein
MNQEERNVDFVKRERDISLPVLPTVIQRTIIESVITGSHLSDQRLIKENLLDLAIRRGR